MQIANREGFAAASRKRLPYDAEVEYISAPYNGSWLDMGFRNLSLGTHWAFSLRYKFDAIPSSGYSGSGYTSTVQQFFVGLNSNSNTGLYMAFNGRTNLAAKLSDQKTDWHTYTAEADGSTVGYKFDGVMKGSYNVASITLPRMTFFRIAHSATGFMSDSQGQSLAWSELTVGGVPIFQVTAVRFTNEQGVSEAAVYDRVSGQLFRNRGHSSLVIGPDVN